MTIQGDKHPASPQDISHAGIGTIIHAVELNYSHYKRYITESREMRGESQSGQKSL